MICESLRRLFWGSEASFWADEISIGQVDFESHSPEWRVLSNFSFQHWAVSSGIQTRCKEYITQDVIRWGVSKERWNKICHVKYKQLERLSMTLTANGKHLPSLFSCVYSGVKLFVFAMNIRRRSIFVCFIYGLDEENSKSEVIFAVCRLPLTACLTSPY